MEKKRYELYSPITIDVRTIVEASSEEEAINIAKERSVSICRHGTDDYDAEEDWVITGDAEGVEPYINVLY